MYVSVTKAPATHVRLNLLINTDCGVTDNENCNSDDRVILSKSFIDFYPWKKTDSFTVTMDNWDTSLKNEFFVDFGFEGTDALSYKVEVIDILHFSVINVQEYVAAPVLTADTEDLVAGVWSLDGVTARGNNIGYIWYLVLPAEISGPVNGA